MSRTYACLFEAGNPWPQTYLDLGTDPFPSINNYSRNLSIDSAPDANLLVTACAFTYVAASLASVMKLGRWLVILRR